MDLKDYLQKLDESSRERLFLWMNNLNKDFYFGLIILTKAFNLDE